MNKIALALLTMLISLSVSAKELVLSSDNTLILNDSFNSKSISKLMDDASKLDANLKSGYPVYLFLYTPGGSIQAGLELIEFLEGLNRPVHTITLFSASMGFQTVQHLGKRYILKYGVLMSHKARGSFSGEFGGGMSQLDSRYRLWLRRVDLMDKQTVSRTSKKQTLTSYRAAYTPELWLNGAEAVEQGYADEVVTLKCGLSLEGLKDPTVEDFGFFNIEIQWAKCPLKTAPTVVKASLITNKGRMYLDNFLQLNGKFGPTCGSKPIVSKKITDYWGSNDEEETPTAVPETSFLCASDKTLTLKMISDKSEERRKFHSRNLRDNIEYSY